MIKKNSGKILIASILFLSLFIFWKSQQSQNEHLLSIHNDLIQQRNELAETITSQEEKFSTIL